MTRTVRLGESELDKFIQILGGRLLVEGLGPDERQVFAKIDGNRLIVDADRRTHLGKLSSQFPIVFAKLIEDADQALPERFALVARANVSMGVRIAHRNAVRLSGFEPVE
ncbi:MAG: hypothetical protein K2X34_11550 [Hyphomonadaceae bacterium]|nr:hypothetical protein [Hyphomonadaceae bacterium]